MRHLVLILLTAFAAFGFLACRCMNVPTSDSTAPLATLRVSYDNSAVVQYVNTTDHNTPITINVPSGKTFTIAYSGNDDGGIKQLHLDYSYTGPTVNGVATSGHPLIAPDDFTSCPQNYRLVAKDFPYRPSMAVQYVFTSSATDFHSHTSNTPTITVKHGP